MSENGEIYTAGNKFYTPAGTDGMDKFHLCSSVDVEVKELNCKANTTSHEFQHIYCQTNTTISDKLKHTTTFTIHFYHTLLYNDD